MLGEITMGFLNTMLFVTAVGLIFCGYLWYSRVKTVLKWQEVEPPMLTSAAGSVQHGFAQYYTDILVVTEFLSDHFRECSVCNLHDGVFCQTVGKARRESVERFFDYDDFFNVIESLKSMIKWVGVETEALI